MKSFAEVFESSDPHVESTRRFTDATVNIERMEQSLSRLTRPAVNLDEAIKQMVER